MKFDLTLAKIKNTQFPKLYEKFILGEITEPRQYESLLSMAICFTNAEDVFVQQLGYRIIVDYCNRTKNYLPLYEIAINNGLYPISKYIEDHCIDDSDKNFFTEWNDAFTAQYAFGGIFQSEQQREITTFFNKKVNETISIIAPTSYGKSELILSAIKEYAGKNICIVTSTKALLMQTKKRIQSICKNLFSKIVVHPEMYNLSDSTCLAVLTQERLLRLLKKDPSLSFDCVIIDEAHELLEDDGRSHSLANVIIVTKKRNPNVAFKFLTPFLFDSENLRTKFASYSIDGYKVSECIKSEKYFLYDVRNQNGLKLYDQFLNNFFSIKDAPVFQFEEDVVKEYAAEKNIIYLNKPTDIEKFALALASILPDVNSDLIQNACDNIASYLLPQYNMLTCLKKGVIYHHGSVPDAIRIFIEDLYRREPKIKFLITSSTLLSGVNLPAERMFILDNRRGKSNLDHDSFKNLVGRVCRFSDIFNKETGSLTRLEPHIYVVLGKYFSKNSNCEKFFSSIAKIDKQYQDEVENVLLSNTRITSENSKSFLQASEYIENYENGTIPNYQHRYTTTVIGKACIMNGIDEIDIFTKEENMQQKYEEYKKCTLIDDATQMLETINDLFLQHISLESRDSIKRLKNLEARAFYAMMFNWRASNTSYTEMISRFLGYWQQLFSKNKYVEVYVGRWGEIQRNGNNAKRYIRFLGKTKSQVINLAIVRIKEEQDFIDNILIKFVETLHDLNLLDEKFYNRIKYGTDNESIICLLKNGLSLSSAALLINKYRKYLQIDVDASTVVYNDELIPEMKNNHENDILIFEIENYI